MAVLPFHFTSKKSYWYCTNYILVEKIIIVYSVTKVTSITFRQMPTI